MQYLIMPYASLSRCDITGSTDWAKFVTVRSSLTQSIGILSNDHFVLKDEGVNDISSRAVRFSGPINLTRTTLSYVIFFLIFSKEIARGGMRFIW